MHPKIKARSCRRCHDSSVLIESFSLISSNWSWSSLIIGVQLLFISIRKLSVTNMQTFSQSTQGNPVYHFYISLFVNIRPVHLHRSIFFTRANRFLFIHSFQTQNYDLKDKTTSVFVNTDWSGFPQQPPDSVGLNFEEQTVRYYVMFLF